VNYRKQRDVRCRKREFIVVVGNFHLAITLFNPQTIAMGRDDRMFVEAIDYVLGELFHEAEVEYIASTGQAAFDSYSDVIVMSVQWFAETRIRDEVGGGEFEVLLGYMDKKSRSHDSRISSLGYAAVIRRQRL
jgi:hypothetical protein